MNDKMNDIENRLIIIEKTLVLLNNNIQLLNNSLVNKKIVDNEILDECKKMGSHINFIENIYENVKHPLGFLCDKIKYLTKNNDNNLTLTNIKN